MSQPRSLSGAERPITDRTIEAVWRIESARLIGGLTRLVRDVGLAEDLAQDALVAALERWPESGVPDKPGAWLMATAKYLAIDALRRSRRLERKHEQLAGEIGIQLAMDASDLEAALDDQIGDDVLSLMFMCCHPVLPTDARIALTLRLLGGLTTSEIARAFIVPEPTVAQRIVRAKRTLAEARVPFEVPHGDELRERLSSVLEVVYLVFNEGYTATAGEDWMRPAICDEALRLGRILASLAPDEPEVHGLTALMELQAARAAARIDSTGEPVLLLEQDRRRWDQIQLRRGLAALDRAEGLSRGRMAGSRRQGSASGPYTLQAAIAACHARARTAAETDWARIAVIYEALARLLRSPVVELNRAVALAMAFGPGVGLELVDAVASDPSLARYHLLPSVRGDLLERLGRSAEARVEFERAASLTQNGRERDALLRRAGASATGPDHPSPEP
jgi:RNA polymerase sigma-70 factor (ECF subfamily)